MNDTDLREMFRRRESDVRIQTPPSGGLVRRARRRQAWTVLISTVVALALVAIPLAGLRLLGDRTARPPTPGGQGAVELPTAPDGFRSAALPYASIAYPDGWFLMDTSPLNWMGIQQPKPIISGPVLQLANFDPDLATAPRCNTVADEQLPADAVLLTVGIQAREDTSIPLPTEPWPVQFQPLPPDTDPTCTLGQSLQASWVAPSGAAYFANLLIGPDASAADGSAVQTAFRSLAFPTTTEPQMTGMSADQGQGSPRLVLDTAVVDGATLSLVVYLEQGTVPWVGISSSDPARGGGALSVGTGSASEGPVSTTMTGWSSGGAVVWGTVAGDVARAEIKTKEAKTFSASIFNIPQELAGGRNAVWGFVDGPTEYAEAVGYDSAGDLLGNPVVATAPPDVIASGTDPVSGAWTLSITHDTMGDGLTFAWETGGGGGGCCLDGKHFDGLILQLDGFSTGGDEPSVVTAFASTQVATVVAAFADETFDGQLFPLPSKYLGPAQVVVVIVPGNVPLNGDLIAYDADGNELARVTVDGGPTKEPAGATPTIDEVIQHLYAARDAAAQYFADAGTFDGIDLTSLGALAPSVTFDRSATAAPHVVSVRVSSRNELAVASTTENGSAYCIGVQIDAGGGGNFYYGRVDASGFEECRGGWGLPRSPELERRPIQAEPGPDPVEQASAAQRTGDDRHSQSEQLFRRPRGEEPVSERGARSDARPNLDVNRSDQISVPARVWEQGFEIIGIGNAVQHLADDVGFEGVKEGSSVLEHLVLRSLHVDLHHDTAGHGDLAHQGVQGAEGHDDTVFEAKPARIERGKRRSPGSRRNRHAGTLLTHPLHVGGDPIRHGIPLAVPLERLEHLRDDLERVTPDRRIDRRGSQREEPRVGTDVDEDGGFLREAGEEVKGQRVGRSRESTVAPIELLGVLAPSRVEHHETGSVDAPFDLGQVRRRGQPSPLAKRGHHLDDQTENGREEREGERPLDVSLETEPALASTPQGAPEVHAGIESKPD